MHPVKQLLIERNGCKCMLCGKEVPYEQINWHHIRPKWWFKKHNLPIDNSYENAALLCVSCHAEVHTHDYYSQEYGILMEKIYKNKRWGKIKFNFASYFFIKEEKLW